MVIENYDRVEVEGVISNTTIIHCQLSIRSVEHQIGILQHIQVDRQKLQQAAGYHEDVEHTMHPGDFVADAV